MKHLRFALLPLAALLTSGCVGRNGSSHHALFATAVVASAIVISQNTEHHGRYGRYERPDDRDYGPSYPAYPRTLRADGHPAPPPEPTAPPAPAFDASGARNALAGVDLTRCRAEGAPRGYGHAKVTMNPSGDISKVVIDEPMGMPAGAAKCIGAELGRATVPVFSGSYVTIGTTWFVP